MTFRLLGATALLIVLGAGAVLLPGWIGDDGSSPTATTSQESPSASTGPSTGPTTGPSADPVGGAPAAAPSASGRVTTEVIVEPPPVAGSAGSEAGPGALPPTTKVLPILGIGSLPRRAESVKGVVAGWPRGALPILAGSRVRSTSVSPGPGVVQLGLDAVVPSDPAVVLRRYRAALSARGFVEQPAADPTAGSAIGFSHGTDSVSVTVSRVESGTSYVVFAVLHPTTS